MGERSKRAMEIIGAYEGDCIDSLATFEIADAIDAYVAYGVKDERERVLACGRRARDWKEWTRMIEDGVWPYEGEM